MNHNIIPNYILIGAGKSGTSSLAEYLRQHPEIFMTSPKELNYYAFTQEKLESYNTSDRNWIENSITNYDEYLSKFDNSKSEKAIGEASGIYLFHPRAARRIKAQLPDVKLFAILRNPIERAYSGYQMHVRKKLEKRTFIDAIKQDSNNSQPSYMTGCYFEKGLYYEQLKRYFDIFPSKQIRVYLYEDLVNNSIGLMQNIYKFLDVDYKFSPDVTIQVNKAPNYTQPILEQDKMFLIEAYKDDITKLESLINRDLSAWLNK